MPGAARDATEIGGRNRERIELRDCQLGATRAKWRGAPPESVGAAEPAKLRGGEVDVDLLGLEILVEAPRAEFAAPAALLVAAPRRFVERGVIAVQPGDARAQRLEHPQAFRAVAREDAAGQA